MNTNNSNFLQKAIDQAIKSEIKKLTEEGVERVKKELELRIPEIVAGISVDVMQMSEMQVMQDRIVFTIRKKD